MTSTNLSARLLKNLNRDGFVILPELFSESEIDTLNAKIPGLWAQDTEANIREKNSNEIRMAMAVHQRDEEFSKLVHDPRLINPAYQIRPEPLYVQQVKVNNKAPLSDDVWQSQR
ncbi:MAG: hypothetical protein GKR97_14490 [Rhizobiaceae bacterium]|nr:hypothetical protein [Rhizobiaceae bacterium]